MDTPLLETLEPNSVPHQNPDGSSLVLHKQTLDGHFLAPPSSNSAGVSPILDVKKTLDQSSVSPSNDAITGSEPSMEGAKIVDDNHNNYQQALVLYDATNLDGSLGAGRIGENQSCYVLKDEDNEELYDDGSPYRKHRDDHHHDVDDPYYRVSPQSHQDHSSNDWRKHRFFNKDWWSPHGESLEIKPTGVGAGLENLGNTCFINAILQCFTHTVPFVQGLRSCNHVKPCHGASEGFCVVCTLCDHIDLSLASSGKVISPTKLFENLNYISSSFERYQQEDAHEFLQCLLDRLERCCLDIKKMDKSLPTPGDNNIVERTFGGRLISKLRCCNCDHCSDTYEPLIDLSLEIEDVNSLQSALESFTKLEKIEDPEAKFTCENCKEVVAVEKQLMLDRAPSVAAFHLKRFKTDGSSIVKIDKHVEFPLELNLQPYTSDGENSDVESKYQLYAIVEHTGYSPTYGHYFSYIRSSPGTWHRLNDSRVTRVQEEFVLSQDAYILFYAKQGWCGWATPKRLSTWNRPAAKVASGAPAPANLHRRLYVKTPEKIEGSAPLDWHTGSGCGCSRLQQLYSNSRSRDFIAMLINKRVIAVCGRAQSGKSTAAGLMVSRAGYCSLSFADPLKRMLMGMGEGYGLEHRHLWGSDKDKNEPLEIFGGKSARFAMQTLGTEWRNLIDPNLWVNHMLYRLKDTDANRVVIDDMRFEHEYLALKEAGAVFIGIESPFQGTSNATHASEVWDFRTTNMPVIQNEAGLPASKLAVKFGISVPQIRRILSDQKAVKHPEAPKPSSDDKVVDDAHRKLGNRLYFYRVTLLNDTIQAGESLGWSAKKLRSIEQGHSEISLADLQDMAEYMKTSISELTRDL
ncbi:hypothetical protein Q3G72_026136 [Acer saccharum]|nr:hypothetical protein Q3G72_026136 [Acer saccharum]